MSWCARYPQQGWGGHRPPQTRGNALFIPSCIERSYSDFSQEVKRGEERTENQFLNLSGTVGMFSENVAPSQHKSSMSSIQPQAGLQNIEWNEGPFRNTIIGTQGVECDVLLHQGIDPLHSLSTYKPKGSQWGSPPTKNCPWKLESSLRISSFNSNRNRTRWTTSPEGRRTIRRWPSAANETSLKSHRLAMWDNKKQKKEKCHQ